MSPLPYMFLPRSASGPVPHPIVTRKLALFDVDGTLMVSRSGRRWATSCEDWIFAFPNIAEVLQARQSAGWTVALISNQSQADKDPACLEKIESLLAALESANGWRPLSLVATGKPKKNDLYRKPARGLYDVLLEHLGLTVTDIEEVTMCGDAAGEDDPYPPYRWSDADRGFANNIGATFERPIDVFGIPKPPVPAAAGFKEVVLLVGNPGSGKSTTGRRLKNEGYDHIEQDVVGSKSKTLKAVKSILKHGKACDKKDIRIVIDATHGSSVNRKPYEELCQEFNIPMRVLWHITNGRPLNALRAKPVPEVAYAVYTKHFEEPEGAEIVYGY